MRVLAIDFDRTRQEKAEPPEEYREDDQSWLFDEFGRFVDPSGVGPFAFPQVDVECDSQTTGAGLEAGSLLSGE